MKQTLLHLRGFLERYRVLPSYGEDTVFLLAVAVLVVLFLNADARAFAEQVRAQSSKIALIMLLGVGFAIYTAFFSYFKNEIQKFYMFWFAVLVNFLSAFATITLLNDSGASPLYYIAPAINVVAFVLMVAFWHADVLDTSAIPHKSSSFSNVLYGTIVVAVLTLVAEYAWNTPWPAVFSFVIGYATVFNRTFTSYLPKIFGKRDQKIEALDVAVNDVVDYMIKNVGINNPYAVCIAAAGTKNLQVSSEYRGDVDAFLADEIRKLNRTTPAIATGSVGTYTFKRYWFSPTRQESAIIIDAYPNDGSTGYQFCQMVRYDTESILQRYKGLIYLNKTTNVYVKV
ncbi:MAG: hypothetical protein A2756_05360 [Candidatus Ryanbacteria bacterium RIFCSPHIGHO2_01_FULL_48_27]|uniref:Uncharacterized protein n=1 Tax=Candidatus Ryanbacteria bacterium RIFCSPHIGHO2_01_FULL_48_27 TaxID=1802115 RepID=A0A1G2G1E4_9BACT|nr:MAG: hypothetical protein A2756_05360 [Candidatus Ryanbacteria bacterium RIFCSPHIGHO2_01_FULL_48_27]